MKIWEIHVLQTIVIVSCLGITWAVSLLTPPDARIIGTVAYMAGVLVAVLVQRIGHKRSMAQFETHLKAISEREQMAADTYVKEALDKIKKAREGTWIS